MMPPRNILPVEMEQMPAMTTIGMEGGIMMPTVEDTPVTVFMGEDRQRPLTERVVRFLEKVNRNHTVIDSRDYALPGIDDAYRYSVSHLVTHAVTNRIDAHLEALSGHDMEIRRYYRKVEY